jgi:adenine-specific DNA-methyltransferase
MQINTLSLRNSINKAYLKVRPDRTQIETFKKNISNLFNQIKESESEEFHKNIISGFLKNTYYSPSNYINTKGRYDLVIHNGKDSGSTVGVIFETKKPGNKFEMPTSDNINTKAFQELILYYLRERITNKNIEIKYLVATNIFEWFIFNASDFEKCFAGDKDFVRQFIDFEEGRLPGTNTDFFYKSIAEPFVRELESPISVTHFDIRVYETIIRNADRDDDNKLIALYKIFSPEHLLKLPFANDSNNLDKSFYNELLHIIGLEETKEGSRKIIGRKSEKKRNSGSLIENSITILKSEDCLSQVPKLSDYGNNKEEQLFNISLELVITWINRILFLKLLEGQLIKYNNGDKSFRFLNVERIHDYDELNKLFFQVLAVKENDRTEIINRKFRNVPFLNSSLFEANDLEHKTIRINSLDDHAKIPVLSGTVLKDKTGRKLTGEIDPIQYLFEFLDSYDFSSEGSEDIQEENKTLINASVLGLIFEKINGYKDGSFFTPGFITMYMCHETIRRAVVQKFNEKKGWKCETISDLYNKIEDIKEANQVINSLRICDPAVGSGHFLVSALNEIIAIKSELKILSDKEGKRLKEYSVEVVNDELIITDEQSNLFQYDPKNKESQRIQEALFQEKQKIIENCLFGVDINPNSVKICRLRLWIELLKNAYYKSEKPEAGRPTPAAVLETLPNIDINIKCGNSLISRYPLDADIKTALKSSRWNVDNYREAVMTYRNAQSKDEKRTMEQLIAKIKSDFETEVSRSDKRYLKLNKLNGELLSLTGQSSLFELSKAQKDEWNKKVKKLTEEIKNLESQISEIKSNKIYENAFEWRFEFPEVLNNDGDFVGFDVVIGNPPYIRQEDIKEQKPYLKINFKTYTGTSDIYVFFVEKGFDIIRSKGQFCFIMPNKWMQTGYGKPLREFLLQNNLQSIIDFGDLQVFEEATTYPCILNASKFIPVASFKSLKLNSLAFENKLNAFVDSNAFSVAISEINSNAWIIKDGNDQKILSKLNLRCTTLSESIKGKSYRGILTGLTEAFVIDNETKTRLVIEDKKSEELIKPFLLGRNVKPYSTTEVSNWIIMIPKGYTIKKNLPESNPLRISEPPPRYGEMIYNEAWHWFKSSYPAIANHIFSFEKKAGKRTDKGDFWWELRACDYYTEFEKPKIMYQKFQVKPCFIYDDKGLYCNDSMWIIPTDNKVLLGVFNSRMGWWLISKYCTAIQNGYQLIWDYFGKIPIPDFNKNNSERIVRLVDKIIDSKKSNSAADTSALEVEINSLVYELYELTEEEIKIVESF